MPVAPPAPKPASRPISPSRQLPAARGSSLRPLVRTEGAPRRDDTTRIISIVAVCITVLGAIALVMMRSGPPKSVHPLAPPVEVTPEPEKPPAATVVIPPVGTVIRPVPPPRSSTSNPTNLATNPSFEQLTDGKPVGWIQQNYNGDPVFTVTANGHRGSNAVCISSTAGADAKWFQYFAVKPNTTYLMKGWAKCENITGPGRGVQFNMEPNEFRSDEIKGTSDWKMLQFTFESRDKTEVYINCLYGGWGQSTGTAWFDDIEVIELFSSK